MMKKILSFLLLLLVFASVLTSCGPQPKPDPSPEPDPSGNEASWEEFYDQGVKFMIQGDVEKANECFLKAAECPEPAMKVNAALGDSYMILGKYDEAMNALSHSTFDDYRSYRSTWGYDMLDQEESCIVTAAYFDEAEYAARKVTRYAVSVEYHCPEGKECTLVCGANCDHPGYFTILDSKTVKGKGVVQFFLDTSQAKAATESFGFYTALYDNSQSGTWIPYSAGAPYHPAETDIVNGSPVTEDEITDYIQLMNGKDVSPVIADFLLRDSSFLSHYADEIKGYDAPRMLALASVATWMVSGSEGPGKTPIYNVGDWPDDNEFYLDMRDAGIMTDAEISEAKKSYFTQFVSLDWVQLFFDKVCGKGVIDVFDWDYSDTLKTSSGYIGLQPFGMEDVVYYTFTYKGFEPLNNGGLIKYTCLRTEIDFDGNTTYYDGSSSTPLSDKNNLTTHEHTVTKDTRGIHLAPVNASFNEVFYVAATAGLRLRKGPSTDYETIQVLPDRTPVFIYEVKDGWARISRYQDGWMSLEYLEDLVDELM